MDRKTERGQMILETLIVVLMFAGFFLVAVTITREGEKKNAQYRFSPKWKNGHR